MQAVEFDQIEYRGGRGGLSRQSMSSRLYKSQASSSARHIYTHNCTQPHTYTHNRPGAINAISGPFGGAASAVRRPGQAAAERGLRAKHPVVIVPGGVCVYVLAFAQLLELLAYSGLHVAMGTGISKSSGAKGSDPLPQ